MTGQYIEPVTLEPLFTARAALPGQCAVCRGWDRGRVCRACIARFASPSPRCRRCALVLPRADAVCGACLNEPPPFDRAIAAVDYRYPWDHLLARLKFHAALDLAPALAALLGGAVSRDGETAPDVTLAMPLAGPRAAERGFNQAWEIARRLRPRPRAGVLLRVKDTPHQLSLPRDARAANVRDAFAVEPRAAASLRGADVALVDDVLTTGASGAEAARTLLRAGARRVRLWVVARTPPPADG